MLFLFHLEGWELRPSSIFQLSMRLLSLLILPHFHGFGSNESHSIAPNARNEAL